MIRVRILCFGDSNTYGYDPRSYLGGRYATENRWVDLLAQETGWEVLNAGENGRSIPRTDREVQATLQLLTSSQPIDLFVVMLGSNDLLQGSPAPIVSARMKWFLERLPMENRHILLIAPPSMQSGDWVTEEELVLHSKNLIAEYRQLARQNSYVFADTSTWKIDITFDGVHFSETGHNTFAGNLHQLLKETFPV